MSARIGLNLPGFSDEEAVEGRRNEIRAEELRQARLEAARRHALWTELPETMLVRRARWYVHAESDELYSLHRGVVFQPGSAGVIADKTPLTFYVEGATGEVVFLDRLGGKTWSSILERQAARERERAHPTPTRIRR